MKRFYFWSKYHGSSWFPIFFLLGILIKYDYLALRIFQVPSIPVLASKNLVQVMLFVLFIQQLVKGKRERKVLLAISVLFTAFFFMNVWYNRYFGNYLSWNDVLMGRGIRPAKVLFLQLMRPSDLLFTLDLVMLLWVHLSCMDYRSDGIRSTTGSIVKRAHIGLVVLAFVLQIAGANFRFGVFDPLVLYRKSTPAFVNVYGIIPVYAFEYAQLFFPNQVVASTATDITKPDIQNDLNGKEIVHDGQNIICIQVESLDSKIIGYRYQGVEVTPFLNQLAKDARYFDNFYAQHVNGSFDAELSIMTSVYPLNKNYGFKTNALDSFDSLITVLNERGYRTLAFHGNDKSFFFRDKAYDELGFDRFYSREDFNETVLTYKDADTTFGLNDYDFLLQSAGKLSENEEPFFAYFITATSHTPFDFYPESWSVKEFDTIQNPLVKGYFNSLRFVDEALEMFFGMLEREGHLEDSLILLYADHDAGIEKEEYASKRNFELSKPVKVPESIPLMVLHPEIDSVMSHKEGSHTDIAPTILDLIGEEQKPSEFMGYSLMGPIEVPVLFLHELPQLLHKGQLFVLGPDGLVPIGYDVQTGEQTLLVSAEESMLMFEYIRDVMFERKVSDP